MTTPTGLDPGAIAIGLAGGLALFLFGMEQMTEALRAAAGGRLKAMLQRMTANRLMGLVAGALATALIQSSSVTTVLVVGFVSAGLMNLRQSIGVILGANIGTTITAQIIAFKIYHYGLAILAVGFLMQLVARRETVRNWGGALLGLGLVFYGMQLMSDAVDPLRQWPPFLEWMRRLEYPGWGILVGAVVTAIVQSSSAMTGMVIVLASQGLISLETGIGLVFGANIGTCVTALLSAAGRPREAVQAAWVHVLFNVGGAMLWVFFIPQFADAMRGLTHWLDPVAGADPGWLVARQIANAHTCFNVINALLFIGFTGPLARLVQWLVPQRQPAIGAPMYLDDMYLNDPEVALDQVRRELVRLAGNVGHMLDRALVVVIQGDSRDIEELSRVDDDIDQLHAAIIEYLGRLSRTKLSKSQSNRLYAFIAIANYLENCGDVIDENLLDIARKRLRRRVRVSPSTQAVLRPLHRRVREAFTQVQRGLADADLAASRSAADSKSEVYRLADQAASHLAQRLVADEPNRLDAFRTESDIIEHMKRINTLTRRIARLLIEIDQPTDHASSP
ncbi:MAG: Na/Pi cotransporter family protein [Planctomycetota bacterium]|nr:MAG: Na/Pi cotransporter family protein [Planctomycetota bacterium]